jgi:DNA-binding MurR/RpiR family transcriptional regulator
MNVPDDSKEWNIPVGSCAADTIPAVEVAERIGKANTSLTPAERRVAEVVLEQPQLVAFGTVADLADAASSGAATVVRLASKLGFDGFTGLQASVQHTLAGQLRPAAERIREPAATDAIGRHLQLELDNVATTLRALEAAALAEVVGALSATDRRVFVLSGDASLGVARQLVSDLHALRDDVQLLEGNDVAVRRAAALLRPTDVVVTIDLRRYDTWVVETATAAHAAGAWCVAITDSLLSPLAAVAQRTLIVAAAGGGPFDSHVGTLALANVLVAGVADGLRAVATDRLDRAESAWQAGRALKDR